MKFTSDRWLYRLPLITLFGIIFLMGAIIPVSAQETSNRIYMTMEEAVQRALSMNNLVRASKFAVDRAKWDKINAWTQFLPFVSMNSRITRIDDQTFAERDFRRYLPPEIAELIPQTVFQQSYFTSIDVSMPIFNGSLLVGLYMAKSNENMVKQLDESTRENIIFEVISTYLNVLKSKEILHLQNGYLELSQRNYEKAERLYNAGRYSKTDALRWKVDLQQQKSVVVNNASVLRSHLTHLKRLLNLSMESPVEIEGHIPKKLITESDQLAQLTDEEILALVPSDNHTLIDANAALAAAESGMDISRYAYRNSFGSYLPSLSASYSYGWRENNTISLDDYSPVTVMINLSVPLFTGFQNYSSMKSAYYEYRQSQEEFADQLKNTRYILTQTLNNLINLKTQRELSKTNTEYSTHNYRVVEQQKEKGLVSNIDFIDAKLNLQNAKLDEINSQYDFITAMVELYYLIGRIETIIE